MAQRTIFTRAAVLRALLLAAACAPLAARAASDENGKLTKADAGRSPPATQGAVPATPADTALQHPRAQADAALRAQRGAAPKKARAAQLAASAASAPEAAALQRAPAKKVAPRGSDAI